MKRIYDWERWFGRRRVVLVYGRDYHCSQTSFAQQIRNAARRLGVVVELDDQRDRFTVVVTGTAAPTEVAK